MANYLGTNRALIRQALDFTRHYQTEDNYENNRARGYILKLASRLEGQLRLVKLQWLVIGILAAALAFTVWSGCHGAGPTDPCTAEQIGEPKLMPDGTTRVVNRMVDCRCSLVFTDSFGNTILADVIECPDGSLEALDQLPKTADKLWARAQKKRQPKSIVLPPIYITDKPTIRIWREPASK